MNQSLVNIPELCFMSHLFLCLLSLVLINSTDWFLISVSLQQRNYVNFQCVKLDSQEIKQSKTQPYCIMDMGCTHLKFLLLCSSFPPRPPPPIHYSSFRRGSQTVLQTTPTQRYLLGNYCYLNYSTYTIQHEWQVLKCRDDWISYSYPDVSFF